MNPKKILRLYSPHQMQLEVHQCLKRYRIASFGRQAGKSTCALNELLKYAWRNPGVTLWFISPTNTQAKVQYRRMLGMLWRCRQILLKKNQTELRLKLINQSQIKFVSGEVLDNLRGETLHGVVIDEVREQHPDLWPLVIRPMLATTKGWALFVSTPNGFDAFYDLFTQAQDDKLGLWAHFKAPSMANPLFTELEAAQARATMTEAQFGQEILAEFRDLAAGRAYQNYSELNHARQSPFANAGLIVHDGLLSPYLPIIVACDFNLSPMAWTLGQERAGQFYWFDEIWLEGSHTPEAAAELVFRLHAYKEKGAMRLNPQVIVVGDSTAKAGQRAAAGKSDYDILLAALSAGGFEWENRTPDSGNPPVKDRVNTVNAKLKSADGAVSMWFHPERCPKLKKDLQRVSWKPKAEATLDQVKDKTLTHATDGIGYAMCALAPIPDVVEVGGMYVLANTEFDD